MKFLIITNHSYMLWQFRRELIAALLERGEVVISMPFVGREDGFMAMGCRCIETDVDRRGLNPLKDIKLMHTYSRLLKEEKPDMVVTYSIKPNIYGGLCCRMQKIPYCVNVQGLGTAFQKQPISSVVTFLYRAALKKAKTVFFENQANAQEFTARRIIPASKEVILNGAGVNLDYYQYEAYPQEAEGIHFLYLGRIMREKGMDELFHAAKNLKTKYGEKIHFDLVGFFEDEYKQLVEQLVKEGIVVFHGFQPDPRPYYASAHCVVLPSYHEGMSNVLLEAAATGRALITTDIPGCREAVEDGKTGFLCKKSDAESLELCFDRFMVLDRTQREELGRAGREKVRSTFDKKMVVEKTISQICR